MSVRLIEPKFVERVWGRTSLAPLYPDQEKKIGEVWFDAGPDFPLLTKFIFTDERLSVQVHPEDEYARAAENSRGKTEMWYIIDAKPGAVIALGFLKEFSKEQIRAGIADGSIEHMLNWTPARAGDTFFTEAGIVHAIGAGITLCEIQQNSDVTYRLFDYGRPRELHLEKGLDVLKTAPYEGRREFPVACEHFTTELLELTEPTTCAQDCDGVLVALEGSGEVGGKPMEAGQVALVSRSPGVRVQPKERLKLLHSRCGADL